MGWGHVRYLLAVPRREPVGTFALHQDERPEHAARHALARFSIILSTIIIYDLTAHMPHLHVRYKSRIFEHNYLPAFRRVGLVFEQRSGNCQTVNNEAVSVGQSIVHAVPRYRKTSKNISIDKQRTNQNQKHKPGEIQKVFYPGVAR